MQKISADFDEYTRQQQEQRYVFDSQISSSLPQTHETLNDLMGSGEFTTLLSGFFVKPPNSAYGLRSKHPQEGNVFSARKWTI